MSIDFTPDSDFRYFIGLGLLAIFMIIAFWRTR